MDDAPGEWKWCGSPHHFIGSNNCHFSLATWVAGGRFLVSTIGEYRPGSATENVPLSVDGDTLYETFVFECGEALDSDCGNPTPESWQEMTRKYAADASAANAGHMALCHEWEGHKGDPPTVRDVVT